MGENIVQLFLKSVLQDTAAFVLLFAVLSFVLRLVSNAAFNLPWVVGLFALFLLLNLAIQTGLLRLDYKKTLAFGAGDNGFLAINYVIKAGLAIAAILVISINMTMINEALELYGQKDFICLNGFLYGCKLRILPGQFPKGIAVYYDKGILHRKIPG